MYVYVYVRCWLFPYVYDVFHVRVTWIKFLEFFLHKWAELLEDLLGALVWHYPHAHFGQRPVWNNRLARILAYHHHHHHDINTLYN